MDLLPKEIADRLPPLYSQEERGDEAIAQVCRGDGVGDRGPTDPMTIPFDLPGRRP